MKKRIIIAVLAAVMTIALAGCSGGQLNKPTPEEGAEIYTVTGECSASLNGDVLTVTGSSDIADGTNGTLSVYSETGKKVEIVDVTQASGQELTYDFTVAEDWPDRVYAFLTFDTAQSQDQPKEIIKMYGKRFQNIEGDYVLWDANGCAAVFQSDLVTIR